MFRNTKCFVILLANESVITLFTNLEQCMKLRRSQTLTFGEQNSNLIQALIGKTDVWSDN